LTRVSVQNLDAAVNYVRGLGKQMAFAGAVTLNKLAQGPVKQALQREMADSLDRPTPFTLRSIALTQLATRDNPVAVVDFKDVAGGQRPAADYLRWQVQGGERRLKGFERMLRSIGVLPGGYFIVPGKGVPLDAYGNVSRGLIVAILSYFQAFPEDGKGWKMNSTAATRARKAKSTKTRRGVTYFVGRPGDGRGPLGIWKRTQVFGFGTEIRPMFIFVQSARYEPRLDLQYAAELAVQRHAPAIYRQALAQAIRTAR
jgi:hypothetical protein